jgi:hypothetical protein
VCDSAQLFEVSFLDAVRVEVHHLVADLSDIFQMAAEDLAVELQVGLLPAGLVLEKPDVFSE